MTANGRHAALGRRSDSRPAGRRVGRGLAAGFLALAFLALAAPWLGQDWLYRFFAVACHQAPERCYRFEGHATALCVRCIWLYLGLAAGHVLFAEWRLGESKARCLVFATAGLLLADVASESLRWHGDWPAVRAATGLLFGVACSWFTLRGLVELISSPNPNLPAPYEPNPT